VVGPDVGTLVFGALLVGELVGPNVGLLLFGALVREVVGPDVGVLLFGALVGPLVVPLLTLGFCYSGHLWDHWSNQTSGW
jgi:hypothetical protein